MVLSDEQLKFYNEGKLSIKDIVEQVKEDSDSLNVGNQTGGGEESETTLISKLDKEFEKLSKTEEDDRLKGFESVKARLNRLLDNNHTYKAGAETSDLTEEWIEAIVDVYGDDDEDKETKKANKSKKNSSGGGKRKKAKQKKKTKKNKSLLLSLPESVSAFLTRSRNTTKRRNMTKRKNTTRRGKTKHLVRGKNTIKKKKSIKPYVEYDLFNGDKWDNYRLGDVILGYFACWDNICTGKNNPKLDHTCEQVDFDVDEDWCQEYKDVWTDPKDRNSSYIKNLHKNFPGSIASKYVKEVGYPKTYKVEDHGTLKKIFTKFKYKKPDPSALVIHLRLGDTLAKEYAQEYSYDMKYYEKLLKKVRKNKKIKKIDIVTGLHINVFVKESNKNLNKIVEMFEKYYPVEVVLTKNPDKDFYYMSNSKYFANSGGGFSLLVTNYLKHDKKNKIYENK